MRDEMNHVERTEKMRKINILLTEGLPASGKSTWTTQFIKKNTNYVNVNRDDLRAMLFGFPYKFTKGREKMVTDAQFNLAEMYIAEGKSIVVSDTNLNKKTVGKWKTFAKENDATFQIKSFIDVSVDTCIKRDMARPNSVGQKVIKDMYNRYMKEKTVPYSGDISLPNAVIFDVDGTLALMNGRSPFDWYDVEQDTPNLRVIELLDMFKSAGKKIIILSGRDGVCRPETERWFERWGIEYDEFFIRDEGNMEKDSIIKERIFRNEVAPKYNVELVVDDRNQVVEMWRSIGLQCWQVADGDF